MPEPPSPPASSAPPTERPSSRFREFENVLVLVGIFFAILMGAMDSLVVSTVLPTIAVDLHQADGVAFVVSGYLVSATIAIPIFSRLSDLSSRRNVFLVGLAIFIAGSALAGLSQNLTELIVFRSVQGFGGGGIFPVAIAMVAVSFPPEVRTRAIAALSASSGLAIVAGPLLGSYIVSVTTWRWVFYINLPFGLFAIAVVALAVGPLRATAQGRFDVPGAALVAGWVGTLMVALVQVSDAGWLWTDPRIVALLAATGLLLAVFVARELRVADPLIPLRTLRRGAIAAANGILGSTGVVFSALITFLSLYVGVVLAHSAGDIRDMIYFLAVPMIVGAGLTGVFLNRVSYRALVLPGLAVSAVSALFLTNLTASTPLWVLSYGFVPTGGIALPLIPLGFGLGLALAAATIAVQNEAPAATVGASVGLAKFSQTLAGAIGVSALSIYQASRYAQLSRGATSPVALQSALIGSYNGVFLVLALCVVAACLCAFGLTGRVPVGQPAEAPTTSADPPGRASSVPRGPAGSLAPASSLPPEAPAPGR